MVIYSVLHRLLFSHSRVEIANDHKDDLKDVTLLELLLIINISKIHRTATEIWINISISNMWKNIYWYWPYWLIVSDRVLLSIRYEIPVINNNTQYICRLNKLCQCDNFLVFRCQGQQVSCISDIINILYKCSTHVYVIFIVNLAIFKSALIHDSHNTMRHSHRVCANYFSEGQGK